MKKIIKEKVTYTSKNSLKRIYLSGREFLSTKFKTNVKFVYEIDFEHKKVRITTNEKKLKKDTLHGKGKVSKKISSEKNFVPLLDIQNKNILQVFNGIKSCKVTIYKDEIVIEPVSENANKKKNLMHSIKNKVIDIFAKKEAKNIIIPIKNLDIMLKKVSGGNEQLSFFDLGFNFNNDVITSNILSEHREDVLNPKTNNALTFASLFCGMGGFDLGFINNGFTPYFALDVSGDKNLGDCHIETYRKNIGDHIVDKDINEFDLSTIPNYFPNKTCSVVIGGPPCQDYSVRNYKTTEVNTPKNRLILKYIEAIEKINPKVFVMENVQQILTKGKKFIDYMKEKLSDFEFTIFKLDSEVLGKAQKRIRAFIIGSKIGKINVDIPKLSKIETIKDAFKGLNDKVPNQTDIVISKGITLERIKNVKPGQCNLDLPKHLQINYKSAYERLDWNKNTGTIDNVSKRYLLHPDEDRVVSVREAMRLQGFPDNFIAYGDSLRKKFQMIGNAVPVFFSELIAKAIKKAFNNYYASNAAVL